jgi:cysteinyl-tRNA synthetase
MEAKDSKDSSSPDNEGVDASVAEARAKFVEHMDNDFNTPYALRVIFELVRDVNRRTNEKTITRKALGDVQAFLEEAGEVLGIGFSGREKEAEGAAEDLTGDLIDVLIDVRQKLREKKDWQNADEIRSRMSELGITLEDAKAGGNRYSIKRA